MSGPKVVRIVTREELEAMCRALLGTVDAAHAQLERRARKSGAWNDDLAATLSARRQALQNLFDRERWAGVQTQAPAEAAFLRSEVERLTEEAVRKGEMARRKRRRIADAARSLTAALEAEGREVPASLRHTAERAAHVREEDLPAVEAELNAGLSLLSGPAKTAGSSKAHQALAARLLAGEQGRSYSDWLEERQSPDEETARRIDRLIAETEVLDRETAAPFIARANRICQESSASQRALLTDSLTLDLSAHLAAERTWQQRIAEMEEVRAALQTLDAGAALSLLDRIAAAIETRNMAEATDIIMAARQLTEEVRRRESSLARRRAILMGLASLGYEVREEMTTAWVKSGRLVLKKPAVADYGVELGAVADGERMQVRVVGAAHPIEARSASRDRDAEVQWCSEVRELQKSLAAIGSDLALEAVTAPGVHAVKTVELEGSEAAVTAARTAAPRLRRIGE